MEVCERAGVCVKVGVDVCGYMQRCVEVCLYLRMPNEERPGWTGLESLEPTGELLRGVAAAGAGVRPVDALGVALALFTAPAERLNKEAARCGKEGGSTMRQRRRQHDAAKALSPFRRGDILDELEV